MKQMIDCIGLLVEKELWQMTKDEFINSKLSIHGRRKNAHREKQMWYNTHYEAIKNALAERKPIPEKVLKGYPNLTKSKDENFSAVMDT